MLTIGVLMALSALSTNDVVTVYPKRDCVQVYQIRSTKVLNDSVLLFELKDGTVWRNSLKFKCPSLAFEDRFSYEISGSSLCRMDTIRVLRNVGNGLDEGASCSLSAFTAEAGSIKDSVAAYKLEQAKQREAK
jgi:hypothetical protein